MSFIFSVASSALDFATKVFIGGVATGAVVFVVGAATKPLYESFAPSFSAHQKMNSHGSVKNQFVTDFIIGTVVQTDFETKQQIEENDAKKKVKEISETMFSYGFLNRWTHGSLHHSSTEITNYK